jgi:hypothetical protein
MVFRVTLVGCVAAISFSPGMAGAGVQSTTCDVAAKATFDPGLKLSSQNQTVTVKGQLTNCVGGGVTSGVFKGKGTGSMSCTSGSGSGRVGVRWNTGQYSIGDITLSSTGTLSGVVTQGKFVGEQLSADVTVTQGPGNCILTPIKSATLNGTLSI